MGIIGDVLTAPLKLAKTALTSPVNVLVDLGSGLFKGGFKWGKIGALAGGAIALAAAPFTGGLSLAAIPAIAGGGALSGLVVGAAVGGGLGGVGGALHGVGESLSNLAQLNGKTGMEREGASAPQVAG